jgi:hypothetical protein
MDFMRQALRGGSARVVTCALVVVLVAGAFSGCLIASGGAEGGPRPESVAEESVASASAGGARNRCLSALETGVRPSAKPDRPLDRLWASYGNSATGWTGGDGGFCVLAPGEVRLWVFGDTFLGGLLPGGRRPRGAPMVHNTIVIQRANSFETLAGGTPAAPHSLLRPRRAAEGYLFYSGPALFHGSVLQLLLPEYHQEGSSLGTDHPAGSELVRLSYPSMRLLGIERLSDVGGVSWSSWVLVEGGYTYIYGVEDEHTVRYMHIARVRGTNLMAPWSYFDGSGWSPDPSRSIRVMKGVDTAYSVVRMDGVYVLVTRSTIPSVFSNDIDAYFGCSPTGPFLDRMLLYRAPQALGGSFVYNAVVHQGLLGAPGVVGASRPRASGKSPAVLVVGYSVDPANTNELFEDVASYRPSYIEATLPLR